MDDLDAIQTARDEGLEKGREDGAYDKSITIAKKMLSKDHSMEDIMELTDLTQEQIQRLL